jgi:thioredoxin-like negative regulator of GroEL
MVEAFRTEPILVLAFTAVNCGPCQLQKKELKAVMTARPQFKMLAIDTDKWPHVGSKFAVGKLPCLVVMTDGQVRLRLEGLTKAEVLQEHVRNALASSTSGTETVVA